LDLADKEASESTIQSGKTHFMQLSLVSNPIYSQHVTPVRCSQRETRRSRFRRATAGMGTGTIPAPETDTTCSGGTTEAGALVMTEIIFSFQMLNQEDAATRDSPLLPANKRPIDARARLLLLAKRMQSTTQAMSTP
jgi:hypothetical protein